jgi:hypothetical protein
VWKEGLYEVRKEGLYRGRTIEGRKEGLYEGRKEGLYEGEGRKNYICMYVCTGASVSHLVVRSWSTADPFVGRTNLELGKEARKGGSNQIKEARK